MEGYLAQIILFAGGFAPRNWAFCHGQILSISQNTALFSLLGTTYGGNGSTTFALPDLRGRVPVGQGSGPGLAQVHLGEVAGEAVHVLTEAELPAHRHGPSVSSGEQTTNRATLGVPARGGVYGTADSTGLPGGAAGSSQPHNNMQPYLGLNYIICMSGIYPSRD